MSEYPGPRSLPNEFMLQHLAASGDSQEIQNILNWLAKNPLRAAAMTETVRAIGMRAHLAVAIGAACTGITVLDQNRPNITIARSRPDREQLAAAAVTFDQQMVNYVQSTSSKIGEAIGVRLLGNHPVDPLSYVSRSLNSDHPHRRAAMLRALSRQPRHTTGELKGQVLESWETVKDDLQTVRQAGDHFGQMTTQHDRFDNSVVALADDWQQHISQGLGHAAYHLELTHVWLNQDTEPDQLFP